MKQYEFQNKYIRIHLFDIPGEKDFYSANLRLSINTKLFHVLFTLKTGHRLGGKLRHLFLKPRKPKSHG